MGDKLPDLRDIRGLIIDMDGVLWRGDEFLPGFQEFFGLLRHRSVRFVLATNNATKTPQMIQARLERGGVAIQTNEILTSAQAAAAFVRQNFPEVTRVFMVGELGLKQALSLGGFTLLERREGSQAVVVGLDRNLTWSKLTEAANAIMQGAVFVGTNPDPSIPIEHGLGLGAGALLAALEAATGVQPLVVGKPEPHLFRQALERIGTQPPKAMVLGDRLDTDIHGGRAIGLGTGLLLTGVTQQSEVAEAEIRPDWIFQDLLEVCKALEGDQR